MTDSDTRGWRNSLRRHDVVVFMLAALILTWVVWVPRAMGTQVGVIGQLWTWIPAMTALGCAAVLYGRAGVRDLGRRLLLWRVSWWWYSVVLLGPLVFALMVAGIVVLLGEPWDAARPPAMTHLPSVWTTGAAMEGQQPWLLLADLLAKSLLFTYVFLGTQGIVLIAILLHASTNLFGVSPPRGLDGDLTVPLVALALKWVLAAALFVRLPRSFGDGRGSGPAVFHWSATPG
jgi:hypothetical protein